MKRITGLSFLMLVVFILSVVSVAQNNGANLCGTFSGRVNLLPSISSSFGLNLTLNFANLTAVSSTSFIVLPAFSATQSFTLKYAWNALIFGSELDLGVVPLAFQSWNVYTKLNFSSTAIGDGAGAPSFGGYFKANAVILPAFSATSTLYMAADVGPLSASSRSVLGLIPSSFQTQKFSLTLNFLSTTFGEAGTSSASGKLGAYIDVLPTLATTVWLDASISLQGLRARSYTTLNVIPAVTGTQVFTLAYSIKSFTLTSKIAFDLSPFGFDYEYIKINFVYEGLSMYGWGQFATSGPSAGVGFSYNFCTGSN